MEGCQLRSMPDVAHLDPGEIRVEVLVQRLGLQPHPEGGWYCECHRSGRSVTRDDGASRTALTQILFLLPAGGISRWHRVKGADEIWQFVAGEPLDFWTLPPQGGLPQSRKLGPFQLPENAGTDKDPICCEPQLVVPADCWQAASASEGWSLASCYVAPGFDFEDFELLRQLPRSQHPNGVCGELL